LNQPVAEIGIVRSSRCVSPDLWDIEVESPRIASLTRAGQFVHVRVSDSFNPLLRRPLSVGPICGSALRLIFHVRGEGTRLLAAKRPGDPVDMIGPLGCGFPKFEPAELLVLLTGGIGVVPLLLLSDQLPPEQERRFILGVRSVSHVPVALQEASERGILWSSDDGSLGFRGNAVQLLEKLLDEAGSRPIRVIGCGPARMLSGMKALCASRNVPALASLETPMGCGVGACQSCAVPRSDGEG